MDDRRGGFGDETTYVRPSYDDDPEPGPDESGFGEGRRRTRWHGGADFGLLVMRLFLAGTFLAHGAQILFGTFGGPGPDGFSRFLEQNGFQNTKILAMVTGSVELGSGALLVLGLLTPLAAAAIIGVMAIAAALKVGNGFFATANGFELEAAIAVMAFGLLFAGPGRVSVDNGRVWYRHPAATAWIFLVIGVAAAAGVYLAFHGYHGFRLG
jgi:putative oxidoreductase